jgi:CRISPR-associated endonuclease/helicase Cas3
VPSGDRILIPQAGEVNSYDVFTGTLIAARITTLLCLKCTVIILSATLTHSRGERLLGMSGVVHVDPRACENAAGEQFPLITSVADGRHIEPIPVVPPIPKPPVAVRFRHEGDCLAVVIHAAHSGACVLWIGNTVDRALATYRVVRGSRREGDPPIGLPAKCR